MEKIILIIVFTWMALTGITLIFTDNEKLDQVWRVITIIMLVVLVILFNLLCVWGDLKC